MTTPGVNWAANFAYEAAAVEHPTSVAEVQELVAASPRVKALGTRHSFTRVADSPGGLLVSVAGLEPEVTVDGAVDQGRMTARVTAGTSFGVVAAELERQGCALANMGSLPHISVGGGTATGTHGSGDTNRVLAASIRSVDLVTADGSLLHVDRSSPALTALAVGLGAFGVITHLELDVEPSYRMAQDIYRGTSWDSVLASFDEVMATAYSVCVMVTYGGSEVRSIWVKRRLDPKEGADPWPPPDSSPDSFHGAYRLDPADLPDDHTYNAIGGVPGPWCDRLPHFRLDAPPSIGGDELQTEYFVERRHAVDALQALRRLGDRIDPHLEASEIRTAAADDLWLSPCYRRDTLCIGFTWRKHPAEVEALLPEIEEALAPFEPRPHWGKLFALSQRDLADRFPRLGDFVDLARRYDPDGKFWNPFLDRLTPE